MKIFFEFCVEKPSGILKELDSRSYMLKKNVYKKI
jgi:hypothetical protein